ncbi:MAG: WXG100 family type VII secretion target [Acidimicrobiales bacterium]
MPDRLEINPGVLRSTGSAVDGTAERLSGAVADLRSALSRVGDCWGDDEPGSAFGESYEPAARNLLTHLDRSSRG